MSSSATSSSPHPIGDPITWSVMKQQHGWRKTGGEKQVGTLFCTPRHWPDDCQRTFQSEDRAKDFFLIWSKMRDELRITALGANQVTQWCREMRAIGRSQCQREAGVVIVDVGHYRQTMHQGCCIVSVPVLSFRQQIEQCFIGFISHRR